MQDKQIHTEGFEIINTESYRPGYLLYPARVRVQLKSGEEFPCVLKTNSDEQKILYEKNILEVLYSLGFPVPKVLGSTNMPDEQGNHMSVMFLSELSGSPLPWIDLKDLSLANSTCLLVSEAVDKIHSLTSKISAHPIAPFIRRKTLLSELEEIKGSAGEWLGVPIFSEALTIVKKLLPRVECPLVFSNGDYNPLNFLSLGGKLTGFVDFEFACFEDPYIGFAKFLLWADDDYGWGAGAKSGLVERFLFEHNVAPTDFLIRLILRGLYHIHGYSPNKPPLYMMSVVASSVEKLKSAVLS